MLRSCRLTAHFAVLTFMVFACSIYVSGQCSPPAAYKGAAWFQLYQTDPYSQWVYGVYSDSAITTMRSDNRSVMTIKYTCESSFMDSSIYYYLYSNPIIGRFCAKSSIIEGGTALFVTEIGLESSATTAASQCPNLFVKSCFTATGTVGVCSAVFKPKTPLAESPVFTPVQCPFQGLYQVTVNYTKVECSGDPASTVTVLGSDIHFETCSGQAANATYKERRILTETMTCMGNIDGAAMTTAEADSGQKFLLLSSSDQLTLYCARYRTSGDTVYMSIDVTVRSYPVCGPSDVTTAKENNFLALQFGPLTTTTASSGTTTPPGSGTTALNTGTTAPNTGTENTAAGTGTANTAAGTGTANTEAGTGTANSAAGTGTANTAAGTGTANTAAGTGTATTAAGTTAAVSTGAQTTGAQTTGAPTTGAATTGAQATGAPTTGAQTTGAPTTGAQTTGAPTTGAATTGAQTTGAPTTGAQTTGAATTGAATTGAATTGAPTTAAPTTAAPTTPAPTSSTAAPTSSTAARTFSTAPSSTSTVPLSTPSSSKASSTAASSTTSSTTSSGSGSSSSSGGSTSSSGGSSTPGGGESSSPASATEAPTTINPCAAILCPTSLQCYVDADGKGYCACEPGMEMSGNSTAGDPKCEPVKSNASKAGNIILGLAIAFLVCAVLAAACYFCVGRTGGGICYRGGGSRVVHKPRTIQEVQYDDHHHYHHHHHHQHDNTTTFYDNGPTYAYRIQPPTFPSRGNTYGGGLDVGGGYAGVGSHMITMADPGISNKSYVMVKSNIPRN